MVHFLQRAPSLSMEAQDAANQEQNCLFPSEFLMVLRTVETTYHLYTLDLKEIKKGSSLAA